MAQNNPTPNPTDNQWMKGLEHFRPGNTRTDKPLHQRGVSQLNPTTGRFLTKPKPPPLDPITNVNITPIGCPEGAASV
ncbi:hypothetical protein PISMIDRAFT_686148 [Pisolithus microcarpus 441]|uniref:Uncharacterized protein n=1 Tax=Pisolithus microcarpus 441 TaxID=765257 RepID=A0A0C9XW59_9AGAM|nr:hypothetical protein PISMIDRAFT_686148 [Pisolithus microcarpus 441]